MVHVAVVADWQQGVELRLNVCPWHELLHNGKDLLPWGAMEFLQSFDLAAGEQTHME